MPSGIVITPTFMGPSPAVVNNNSGVVEICYISGVNIMSIQVAGMDLGFAPGTRFITFLLPPHLSAIINYTGSAPTIAIYGL